MTSGDRDLNRALSNLEHFLVYTRVFFSQELSHIPGFWAKPQILVFGIILGKKEADAGKISVRSRANKELENISSADDFITSLLDIINTKKLPDNQQS